ncbi:MAG TPA: hypothetical protein VEC35_01265 [Noviherbaspirillum sp.]|nr:hypothetical protein [Noviherbaspirillum sp.]
MSAANDQRRRELGFDLIEAARRAAECRPISQVLKSDQRKTQDEQCEGVSAEVLKGTVLGFAD